MPVTGQRRCRAKAGDIDLGMARVDPPRTFPGASTLPTTSGPYPGGMWTPPTFAEARYSCSNYVARARAPQF